MLMRVPKWAWTLLGISALMLTIFLWGWHYGASRVEARIEAERASLQRRLAQVADDLSEAEAELEEERAAREALAWELENEASLDPGAALRRPSPDSLRRLDRRWQR